MYVCVYVCVCECVRAYVCMCVCVYRYVIRQACRHKYRHVGMYRHVHIIGIMYVVCRVHEQINRRPKRHRASCISEPVSFHRMYEFTRFAFTSDTATLLLGIMW